ncbi:MAG: hypothetical protein WD826_08440 [Actinomycetota bacterium]
MNIQLKLKVDEGVDEPLEVIRGIVDCSEAVDRSLTRWVAIARRKGHSWEEIGKSLRVSRQSAWERFKRADDERGDAIDRAFGAFAGRGIPSVDELRRQAREEDEEAERRREQEG